ncbi:MAG: hypothetical protein IKX40_05640 [Thermoguttaceae bacterium]|nr:hypothetical protein [Thermoguttaceae bacterium]
MIIPIKPTNCLSFMTLFFADEKAIVMKRNFYLALGTFLILLALECLAVNRFVFCWEPGASTVQAVSEFASENPPNSLSAYVPPPWLPWSLFCPGIIVILYGLAHEK